MARSLRRQDTPARAEVQAHMFRHSCILLANLLERIIVLILSMMFGQVYRGSDGGFVHPLCCSDLRLLGPLRSAPSGRNRSCLFDRRVGDFTRLNSHHLRVTGVMMPLVVGLFDRWSSTGCRKNAP